MMRMISLLLILIFALCMVACGESSEGTDSMVPSDSSTATGSIVPSTTDSSSGGTVSDSDGGMTDASSATKTDSDVSDTGSATDTSTDTSADTSSTSTDTGSSSTSSNEGVDEPEDSPYPTAAELSAGNFMAITDQKNDEIVVVDLSHKDITSEEAIVWRWNAYDNFDVPNSSLSNKRLDDVRIRDCAAWGGTVVGATSSTGLVVLVSYPSGECLFAAEMKGYGPHSIEILPNGLIAVAGSGNGNNEKAVLRIYRASSLSDNYYVEVPLASAHGVLWDSKEEALWALGNNELNLYTVGGTRENPTITLKKTANVKFGGGHDLSPVYGNPDLLWLTGSGVFVYSKSKDAFLETYDGKQTINVGNVKSINTYSNGITVTTIADSKNPSGAHNTDVVRKYFYEKQADGSSVYKYVDIDFNGARDFYKVRAFMTDYQ